MQDKPLLRFNGYLALLIILISLVIVSNFIWLTKNQAPPTGNGLQDLFPGVNFYQDIKQNKINFSNLFNYIKTTFFTYPPLVPVSYALFYFFFTPGSGIELMANTLYLVISLLSIYGICKKIFNQKIGLLAAFVFSSFPGIISLSRKPYSEFITMCLITLTLYLLLKADYFSSTKYSVMLGISLGLTALSKWEFAPALIGPFTLILWKSNSTSKNRAPDLPQKKARFINLSLAIILGIIIASIWYLPGFKDMIYRLFIRPDENIFINSKTTFDERVFSLRTFSYYPLTIINVYIRFFYFLILFLIGIVFAYRIIKSRNNPILSDKNIFYVPFLALWIIIPYLIFTPIKINAPSHIMLILPAIAIIISAGVFSFKNKITKFIFIFLILLYGFISHFHSFFHFSKVDPIFNYKIVLNRTGKIYFTQECMEYMRDCWNSETFGHPNKRNWKIKDILFFIKEDSRNIGRKPVVLILSSVEIFFCFSFQYYNLLRGYNLFIEPRGNDRSEFSRNRSQFDYIVINSYKKEIDMLELDTKILSTLNIEPKIHRLDNLKAIFFKRYKLIKEYTLPDNSLAKIYKLISNNT